MSAPLEMTMDATPNPNAAKFSLNRTVSTQGATYRDPAATEPAWAKQLLAIPGVTQVFAIRNFISVSKRADAEWGVIGPQVERVLRQAFAE